MASSITFDFLSTGGPELSRQFKSTGDNAAAAAKGAKVLQEVIKTLGDKENRTAAESANLARALRLTGDAEDRAAAKALAAEIAIKRLDESMAKSSKATDSAKAGFAGLAGEITGFGAAADAASSGGNKFQLAMAGLNLASGVLEPALAGVVVAAGGLAAGFAAAGAGAGRVRARCQVGIRAGVHRGHGDDRGAGRARPGRGEGHRPVQDRHVNGDDAGAEKRRLRGRAERIPAGRAHPAAGRQQGDRGPVPAGDDPRRRTQQRQNPVEEVHRRRGARGRRGFQPGPSASCPTIRGSSGSSCPPSRRRYRGILAKLNTGLNSAGFKSFVGALAANAGPAITKIATAIGNVIVGIGGILKAFLPTSQTMLSGIDKITAKFREWGTTLSGHSGFQSLMATFRSETPQAVAILKNLGTVLGNVGKAMFGLSSFSNSRLLLYLLLPLSGVMASLSKNTDLVRVALYALLAVKIGQQFTWIGRRVAGARQVRRGR